jgi:hypothetical protein
VNLGKVQEVVLYNQWLPSIKKEVIVYFCDYYL